MDFEWDDNKDIANLEKHGFVMAQGVAIWGDANKIDTADLRFDYGEDRFVSIGKYEDMLLSVCWTIRNGNVRIISVRIASKKERRLYNDHS